MLLSKGVEHAKAVVEGCLQALRQEQLEMQGGHGHEVAA